MTLIAKVRNAVAEYADSVGMKRNGNIVIRRGYFYTHGMTSDKIALGIIQTLRSAGFLTSLIDSGDQFKAFNGGHSVAQGSHWWAEVKIHDQA